MVTEKTFYTFPKILIITVISVLVFIEQGQELLLAPTFTVSSALLLCFMFYQLSKSIPLSMII